MYILHTFHALWLHHHFILYCQAMKYCTVYTCLHPCHFKLHIYHCALNLIYQMSFYFKLITVINSRSIGLHPYNVSTSILHFFQHSILCLHIILFHYFILSLFSHLLTIIVHIHITYYFHIPILSYA